VKFFPLLLKFGAVVSQENSMHHHIDDPFGRVSPKTASPAGEVKAVEVKKNGFIEVSSLF
jgi:hypothetical protein